MNHNLIQTILDTPLNELFNALYCHMQQFNTDGSKVSENDEIVRRIIMNTLTLRRADNEGQEQK